MAHIKNSKASKMRCALIRSVTKDDVHQLLTEKPGTGRKSTDLMPKNVCDNDRDNRN